MTRENTAALFCPKNRKVSYTKRKRALTAAARLAAATGNPRLRVYKCEVCRRWHMTSKIKETAR